MLSAFAHFVFRFVPTTSCAVFLFCFALGETKVQKNFVICLVKLGFNPHLSHYCLLCSSAFLLSFSLRMIPIANISHALSIQFSKDSA